MVQGPTPGVPDPTRGAAPRVAEDQRCLLETRFAEGEVTGLRRQVGEHAAAAGLDAGPADDFVLAVNEAMSNAVRHGGGGGVMRVWRNGELIAEISDEGPGFDVEARTSWAVPPRPSPTGGLGLWLASQVCDTMSIESGPDGTVVRVSARLPGR
ncbi:ATP-binding protein [Solwaraspora sp. WMMD1047]|uniref:ATP-binding protein n=1 Tax=Solwaraspora sp. WMMD1047 TaxID=3016102 RepID=UPI002415D5BC|nr:ATP-binding protein [Solwaraspora sp. WMMD1047]MDG4828720.1 ATP-binding protein [Solwaraspora sp. WMMD1047]